MSRAWSRRSPRRGVAAARPRSVSAVAFDLLLTVAILLLLGLVAARLERSATIAANGMARIADGDSLEMDGTRIRLRGIDAPELAQACKRDGLDYACGQQAKNALQKLVAGRPVECSGSERDRYGRLLAVCRAGDTELNRQQILAGWAIAYGAYSAEEAQARAARRGLWAGSFEAPGVWRAAHGGHAEAPHDPAADALEWLRRFF